MKSPKQTTKPNYKKVILRILIAVVIIITAGLVAMLGIDAYVKSTTKKMIIEASQYSDAKADCILVLGALVRPDGTPSKMLKDRLDRAIELYQSGAAPKLLMSGDHGSVDYDEVNEMKKYAIAAGVPSEDIFMDHAGFSTYESVYRAKEIFGAKEVIIVTQRYHIYRALYTARTLDLTAVGVPASDERYGGQLYRDLREMAARNKDFFYTILKVKPTYLGDPISLQGSGDVTNDQDGE